MQDSFYKEKLYPLQDKILLQLSKINAPFYLTGGTALSRFMLHHRYSEDLDLFVNRDTNFRQEVEKVLVAVKQSGYLEVTTRGEDFLRVIVSHNNVPLKLEFINDVSYRVGMPARHSLGFLMDTWENILTNKISALSRQAAKDVVDILFIAFHYPFNWETMINHAKQKDAWVAEHEVANILMNFDLNRLEEVSFTTETGRFKPDAALFRQLARDAFQGNNNSLYTKK